MDKKNKTKINSLNIVLFKGFKNTEIKFSSGLNILVGGNNSGKSSILHAIHLAFHFLKLTNGINEIDQKRGIKERQRGITVKSIPLPFHDDSYLSEGLKKRSKREQATKIKISIKDKVNFLETLTYPGGNLLVISSNESGGAGKKAYQVRIKKIIKDEKNLPLYIPTFSGVSNKEEVKIAAIVKHYLASGRSSEVLRNQLEVIAKNKSRFKKLNSYLKTSFDVEIVSNDTREIYISSLYKESEYDNLDISSAGSGFQQILQILVFIVSSDSNIILIDEPDAHLHYKLQNILYNILLEMANEGKQIIVATHSQIFIRRAIQNSDRLILVNKKLNEQKAIDEYSVGLRCLYEEGLIDENEITQGGSLKLIDIEDAKDGVGFNIIKEWLRVLGVREPNYKIISAGEHIFGYIATRDSIDNISLKSLILRDGDSLSEDYLDKIEAIKSKGKLSLKHWRSHEIENYLLNEKVIARALRIKGVSVGASKIKKIIQLLVNKHKDFLLDKMDATLDEKIKKYHRELNIEFGEISKIARRRRIFIRDNHLSHPFSLLPGKELFRLLKGEIHKKYHVSISEIEVAKSFNLKDIPIELKNFVKFFQE